MRRRVLTLAFAAVSLTAALPTAAAQATGPAAPALRSTDGGVYASATSTDAQQRAFWAEHDSKGTLRPFKGELPDWTPKATRPKAGALGGKAVKAPATSPARKAKSLLAAGSMGEIKLRATTGRIRMSWPDEKNPDRWWWNVCTGNVVTSGSKDMIATARHCIIHDDQGRINTKAKYEFTPGYYKDANGEHAPYGTWTFRDVGVVGNFTNAPQNNDSAFLTLNTRNGAHVEETVGASGYQFSISSLPNQVVLAGIPDSSKQFHTCVKQPYWGPDNPPQILGRGGPCTGDSDLSGGASGGPLLNGDTFDSSSSVQIGNFSGSLGDDPAAAVWRDAAYAVFRNLEGGSSGQPAHDKVTTLTNYNNSVADLYEYKTDNGTAVYSYHATQTENQQWHLWDKGNGYFLIENRYTERRGFTGANARVLDYNYSNGTAWSHQINGGGSDNQLWKFRATPNRPGWYSIRSKRGDLCLGAPTGEGQLTVSSCATADGLDSMQWKLQ
ncbi:RICIN domain-containing protein [Streptomyces melanogenes]|uniref:RICIN domain-containing protein n=1 Tax=Streptomyces melanogenes TaxID=67326 RepID=UPI00167DAFA1|nr:RICIN domain-containing protein [Streptomyces melanogenes]GGP91281.1 hypothetical protein GCM10010278_81920 [Streptomyces melanogenes]